MQRPRVVVVDDEPGFLEIASEVLNAAGFRVEPFQDPLKALDRLKHDPGDVLLLDIHMPGLDGVSLLERLRVVDDPPEAVIMTGRPEPTLLGRAMRAGAYDLITKPASIHQVLNSVKNAVSRRVVARRARTSNAERFIGTDTAGFFCPGNRTAGLRRAADDLANYFAHVLVTGPAGSGKGAFVRLLRELSDLRTGPLVHLPCAGPPSEELESSLVGRPDSPGAFARADGGILWLSDVESLPPPLQAKLAQYTETGLFPGFVEHEVLDVRIVATSRVNLRSQVERERLDPGFFRAISQLWIEVPGLDERRDEVLGFAGWFVSEMAGRTPYPIAALSPAADHRLRARNWPGGLTELRELLLAEAQGPRSDLFLPVVRGQDVPAVVPPPQVPAPARAALPAVVAPPQPPRPIGPPPPPAHLGLVDSLPPLHPRSRVPRVLLALGMVAAAIAWRPGALQEAWKHTFRPSPKIDSSPSISPTLSPDGRDAEGYDRNGLDRQGRDRDGRDRDGFDRQGYDREGYGRDGFDRAGKDREGFARDGFDAQGRDRDGLDRGGRDRWGYDRAGLDAGGRDKSGRDRHGFDAEGRDRRGFDARGLDRQGRARDGFDRAGFDRDGFDRRGFDRQGFDRQGRDARGLDRAGFDAEGRARDGADLLPGKLTPLVGEQSREMRLQVTPPGKTFVVGDRVGPQAVVLERVGANVVAFTWRGRRYQRRLVK